MIWFLFVLFVLLQIADVVTTRIILNHGGKELNPIMAYVLNKAGFKGLILVKLIGIFIIFITIYLSMTYSLNILWFLSSICLVYFAVVLFNLITLFKKIDPIF